MRNNVPNHEKPTTELFLDAVIERTDCRKHDAEKGLPCWGLEDATGVGRGAVCNKRAKRAGFKHPINEKSLRLNRFKK